MKEILIQVFQNFSEAKLSEEILPSEKLWSVTFEMKSPAGLNLKNFETKHLEF